MLFHLILLEREMGAQEDSEDVTSEGRLDSLVVKKANIIFDVGIPCSASTAVRRVYLPSREPLCRHQADILELMNVAVRPHNHPEVQTPDSAKAEDGLGNQSKRRKLNRRVVRRLRRFMKDADNIRVSPDDSAFPLLCWLLNKLGELATSVGREKYAAMPTQNLTA